MAKAKTAQKTTNKNAYNRPIQINQTNKNYSKSTYSMSIVINAYLL